MRLAVVMLAACAQRPVATAPLPALAAAQPTPTRAVPDVHCAAAPHAHAVGFRHRGSRLAAAIGGPAHRGDDLIALADEDQHVTGVLAYGFERKALEDETVELYACESGGAWTALGATQTDGSGHFAIALDPAHRLAPGLRDLYVRVPGDDTGVALTAFVAPARTPIVVVDVDGTLTTSENAFPKSVVLPIGVAAQPYAAAALAHAPAQIVYLTARGEHFATTTRRWLAAHDFPRGPVRFAPGWFARPGADALAAKNRVLGDLAQRFTLAAGIGNRASDVAAYAAAGIAARAIFMKLPEHEAELAPLLAAHAAVGFTSYAALTFDRPDAP